MFITDRSPIVITIQPHDTTAAAGTTAEFTVAAIGEGLSYQWQESTNGTKWVNTTLAGNKTRTLIVPAAAARNGYSYRCKITNASGYSLITDEAALITKRIAITWQPFGIIRREGTTAEFAVTAIGSDLIYQWQYLAPGSMKWANTMFMGNKTARLFVIATLGHDGYQYRCKVTDAAGSIAYSEPAVLMVNHLRDEDDDSDDEGEDFPF